MEKKSAMLPLALAIVAVLFYLGALASYEKQLQANYQMVSVLAAQTDIPRRTLMKPEYVTIVRMPRLYMPQDAFEAKTDQDRRLVSNMVTEVRIPKGNAILQSELVPVSPEAGLSVKIPPGYRGMELPIQPEIEKLLKPGDHVDVLVTFNALLPDNRKEKVTATILQNVLVLAVGSNMGQGTVAGKASAKNQAVPMGGSSSASLALNPNEAQYLALAMKEGDTTVVVRGLGDFEMHPMEMASFRRLFR